MIDCVENNSFSGPQARKIFPVRVGLAGVEPVMMITEKDENEIFG